MVLVIDNYDSFTYNLVQYLQQLNIELIVLNHDEATPSKVKELRPSKILISPGPGNPLDAQNCVDIVKEFHKEIPIFGVCLGLQIIVHAFGGKVNKAKSPMHGKEDWVYHDGRTIFSGMPSPYRIIRYHSLIADPTTLPACLAVSGTTDSGEIMAVRHKEYPIEAVQFHPESILTEYGHRMLDQFFNAKLTATSSSY